MGWLAAFLALLLVTGWWRGRRRQAAEHARIGAWLEALLAGESVRIAATDRILLRRLVPRIEQLSESVGTLRRHQSSETANLEAILAGMAEGVLVVDARRVVRRTNPSLLRMFGLAGDPSGQTLSAALHEIRIEELVAATLASGQPQNADLAINHGQPPRQLAVAATPIVEASGGKAVLLIFHDVTRLRQLEDVRREFVANVSHELRTPLAIFQGYLETLLDNPGLPRADLIATLDVLKKHSARLNALVEDLLIIARLESRTDRLNLELIEPHGLIADLGRDWQLPAAKKKITFTAECVAGAAEFEADAFRLEQVLNNLVDNALKYTEPGGRVTLRALPCEAGIEFRVEDTGIGIKPEDLPHIFERFYRADKARSREQGGTGLGLSIVKHIVQLHGGSVRAESVFGQGTTIILRLPLTAPSPAQPRGSVQPGVNGGQD
jgi:two-component system phosphate regulon sensor histidine kinase PhoR